MVFSFYWEWGYIPPTKLLQLPEAGACASLLSLPVLTGRGCRSRLSQQISPARSSCCLPCPREPNSAPVVPPPFISMSSTFKMQCFPEKTHSNSSLCAATEICTSLMAGSDLGAKHQNGIFLLLLLFALAFFPLMPLAKLYPICVPITNL